MQAAKVLLMDDNIKPRLVQLRSLGSKRIH